MRIFFSPDSDPLLLDSLDGMNTLHERLTQFLSGPAVEMMLAAETSGSPEPYETFLPGIRVRKTGGPILLQPAEEGHLSLCGSVESLTLYFASFKFRPDEEGSHHHPEQVVRDGIPLGGFIAPGSMSLIVEVDSEYGGD